MKMTRRNRLAVALASNDQEQAIFLRHWDSLTLEQRAELEDEIDKLHRATPKCSLLRWLIFMGALALQEHEAEQLCEDDDDTSA